MGNSINYKIGPENKDFYGNLKDVTYEGRVVQVIKENKFVINVNIPYYSSRKYIVKGYGYRTKDNKNLKDNLAIVNKYINGSSNKVNFYFHGMDENGTLLVTIDSEKQIKTLNEVMRESDNNEIELNYSVFSTVM